MKLEKKRALILDAGKGGRFFTVRFIKRTNGKVRTMNCRLNVQKHLRGGTKAYDPDKYNLVTVYDVQKKGYRSIPLDTLYYINGRYI